MVSYVARGENSVTIAFETIGENEVKVFSLDPLTRARRLARKAGLDPDGRPDPAAPRVVADLGYAWDPAWLRHVAARPGAVITPPVLAAAAMDDSKYPGAARVRESLATRVDSDEAGRRIWAALPPAKGVSVISFGSHPTPDREFSDSQVRMMMPKPAA